MGRVGQRAAAWFKPFDVHTSYIDYRRPSDTEERILGTHYSKLHPTSENSDVVNINFPTTPATRGFFDRELLCRVKKGAYLANTAWGE